MISLRKACRFDKPKIISWLKVPHVHKFWGDGGVMLPDFDTFASGNPSVFTFYIIENDNRSIGLLLISKLGLREFSIDILIGDASSLRKGFGREAMNYLTSRILPRPVKLIVDPLATNFNALAFYKSCGFILVEEKVPKSGDWKGLKHLIMKKELF